MEELQTGSLRCRPEDKIFGFNEVFPDAPRPTKPSAASPGSNQKGTDPPSQPDREAGPRCPTCGSTNLEQRDTGGYRCIDEEKIFTAAEVAAAVTAHTQQLTSADHGRALGNASPQAAARVHDAQRHGAPVAQARPEAADQGWAGGILVVREVPGPDATADREALGLLYPVPDDSPDAILLEPRDGSQIHHLTSRSFEVMQGGVKVASSHGIALHLYITDARVAFACSKYDKGSTWVGNSPLALPLTVASKTLAAARRRGKMLVGQIRYPSLSAVGSTARTGAFEQERLMFAAATEEHVPIKITCVLPKQQNAAELAAEITRRAAAFRLSAEEDLASETVEELEALRAAAPRPAPHHEQRFHRMPIPAVICERAARLAASPPA